ncbi:MAG: hypothetical protein M3146_05160 [Thermoproteota archaeon]|nr:hypothetical protein [Thermoproteota archaeon]
MFPKNHKQLLIGGIILGSIIFFNNQLSSYAQDLPAKTGDTSGETLDIFIPSPTLSGQEPKAQEQFMISGNEEQEEDETPQHNNDDDRENSDNIPMELAIPFP